MVVEDTSWRQNGTSKVQSLAVHGLAKGMSEEDYTYEV